jgi:hypothetical protein
VDAGAISARAKPAAAAEKARDLQAALKARGCVEEFTADPELMAEGQVRVACYSMLFMSYGVICTVLMQCTHLHAYAPVWMGCVGCMYLLGGPRLLEQ